MPVSVCFRGCQLKDTEEGCVGGAQSAWDHECEAMLCLEISGGARGGLMAENKERVRSGVWRRQWMDWIRGEKGREKTRVRTGEKRLNCMAVA